MTLRESLSWASAAGLSAVQLSATDKSSRPRDLSESARRDLRATLTRLELRCSGVDLFIPVAHWSDPSQTQRAFEALVAAIKFAAVFGAAPVFVPLPEDLAPDLLASIAAEASREGIAVLRPASDAVCAPPFAPCVDCAAVLAAAGRPEDVVARLGAALGGLRVVDLLRNGLRGPILEPRESRLDVLALKVAIEVGGFRGFPVLDARQWSNPRAGLERSLARWSDCAP